MLSGKLVGVVVVLTAMRFPGAHTQNGTTWSTNVVQFGGFPFDLGFHHAIPPVWELDTTNFV